MNRENLPVIAVIISIFALLVAFSAWNQTNTLLNPANDRQVRALIQRVELEDLRGRLEEVRVNIEQGMAPEAVQSDLAAIRRDLARNIENASDRAPLEDIDRQLEILEQGVREGAADVLDTLGRIITALEEEIRYDEPND